MSEILEKNLSYIKNYNPCLVNKILAVNEISRDIQLNTNLVGEYNIVVEGFSVHAIAGAQEEAKAVYKELPHNTDNSIHIIYGLGLGYLFDEFVQNSHGSIIVVEPDVELMRTVLELVDFSESFEKKPSYFVSDLEEFRVVFENVYRYASKVSLSSIDYYTLQTEKAYHSFKEQLEKIITIVGHNFSFQVSEIYDFLYYTTLALDKKFQKPLLTDYKDMLKNKPAVIVSAGPSLAKNIEKLKNYKDNVFIFCVGTALKTLCKNELTPDFLHVIERIDSKIHYDVPESKDMIMVCEPYTNNVIYDTEFKQILLTASEETDASRWYMDKTGKEQVDFETKGTVSYHALYSAMYLGCNPIILLGQDLAYSDGNCYAKGSAFEDLQCIFDEETQKYKIYPKDFDKYRDAYYASVAWDTETKTQMLNKKLEIFNADVVTVDGQNDEKMPTSNVYALFIEYIKDFGQRYKNKKTLINSSVGGAKIEGFELFDIEDAILKYAQNPIDKKNYLSTENFKQDIDLDFVISSIKKDIDDINTVLPMLQKGGFYVRELKNEVQRSKTLSQKVVLHLKKCIAQYAEITNNYANKSRILRMIALKHHTGINYLMKEYLQGVDESNINSYFDALNSYFSEVLTRAEQIKMNLSQSVEELIKANEISNSKS